MFNLYWPRRCPIPDCRRLFMRWKMRGTVALAANQTVKVVRICDDCQTNVLVERAQLVAEHAARDFFSSAPHRG